MKEAGRVMVISAKVGAGHMRAAVALEEAFAERFPDIDLRNIDAPLRRADGLRHTLRCGYRRAWTAGSSAPTR